MAKMYFDLQANIIMDDDELQIITKQAESMRNNFTSTGDRQNWQEHRDYMAYILNERSFQTSIIMLHTHLWVFLTQISIHYVALSFDVHTSSTKFHREGAFMCSCFYRSLHTILPSTTVQMPCPVHGHHWEGIPGRCDTERQLSAMAFGQVQPHLERASAHVISHFLQIWCVGGSGRMCVVTERHQPKRGGSINQKRD